VGAPGSWPLDDGAPTLIWNAAGRAKSAAEFCWPVK
jgi:hypothetical protein